MGRAIHIASLSSWHVVGWVLTLVVVVIVAAAAAAIITAADSEEIGFLALPSCVSF
jgi:hypothetical protein